MHLVCILRQNNGTETFCKIFFRCKVKLQNCNQLLVHVQFDSVIFYSFLKIGQFKTVLFCKITVFHTPLKKYMSWVKVWTTTYKCRICVHTMESMGPMLFGCQCSLDMKLKNYQRILVWPELSLQKWHDYISHNSLWLL